MIWLGLQGYLARQQARQDKKGNMLGKPYLNPPVIQRWYLENAGWLLTADAKVHIHADKSSQIKTEHHRHSTNAIVSLSPLYPLHEVHVVYRRRFNTNPRPSTPRRQETSSAG